MLDLDSSANMAVVISPEERAYLVSGIQQNYRTDGRSCSDYNYFTVETGIISSATGSAEVKLSKTHVLVGVKAELAEPNKEDPKAGRVEFFVDCTAMPSPVFEGRDDVGQELTNAMEHMVNRATFDMTSLCIAPGKISWVLYLDVEVLEHGGNLFDAISLAVKAALYNTEIPNVEVRGEAGELDIEVSDDQYDVHNIDVSQIPLVVTVNKIGNRFVLDGTTEEEACCEAKLLVAVDSSGCICGMQKYGEGGINPDLTSEMIEVAKKAGVLLNENLMNTLNQELLKRREEHGTAG